MKRILHHLYPQQFKKALYTFTGTGYIWSDIPSRVWVRMVSHSTTHMMMLGWCYYPINHRISPTVDPRDERVQIRLHFNPDWRATINL